MDGVLCSLPTQLLPALLTSLGLDVNGTVGQFVEGSAPAPTGSVTVLGSPAPLNGGRHQHRHREHPVNTWREPRRPAAPAREPAAARRRVRVDSTSA
ncbi:MAG: hypothetical protein WDM88_01990 [Galbitalea sp.]